MTDSSKGPAKGRGELPPIKFQALAAALLDCAEDLCRKWLPGGKRVSGEWVCGSLAGEPGGSLSVNLVNGRWGDFSSDERGGDLVSLYAAIHTLDMGKAAVAVAREEGLEDVAGVQPARNGAAPVPRPVRPPPPPAAPKPRESEGWRTVRPVPVMAPAPTFKHYDRKPETLTHTFEYRSGPEALHGYVVRFRTSDGGKDTLPYTWCQSARDGAMKWHWKQWDEPRPLYLPGRVLPTPAELAQLTVVVVEGERKADVLHELLAAHSPGVYLVVSWPGGSKAWAKADWTWLTGARTVLLWPDCDAQREQPTQAERKACTTAEALDALKVGKPIMPEAKQPGTKAMVGIGNHLREVLATDGGDAPRVDMARIPQPGEVPSGWDAADAIETDGWGIAEVLAFFGTAYACPLPTKAGDAGAEAGEGAAAAPAEKKRVDPVGTEGGGFDGDDEDGGAWLSPFWNKKKQYWMVSRELVIAALHHDSSLQGRLGLNLLSNNIEVRSPWPWQHGRSGALTNNTDLALGRYLSQRYGLPAISRAALMEGIETVAHERPFHPVQDWLQGLQWDGVERLNKWLVHVLRETDETIPMDLFDYLSLVGRYWLLGMVNRVMEPGCKFDYCPVMEGPGGLGKSTMAEVLAGSAWFSDTHFDVSRGKEGQEQVQGLWVYEIAEMAQFGKAEVELIKAFISAKVDRYRPSYGRVVEKYPRQCVMVGTTNQKQWLRDRTGNRRFWPVPVRNRINIDWLAKWREQLFAEAFELYMQQAQYYPTPEQEARLFVPQQESRLVESAVMSELLHVLTRQPGPTGIASVVNDLAEFVTISQLTTALGIDAAKSSPALEAQIRGWLEHEGWERAKRQINGVRAWGYVRPKGWPPEEAVPTPPIEQGAGAPDHQQEPDDAPF